jgi:hypothetical protein
LARGCGRLARGARLARGGGRLARGCGRLTRGCGRLARGDGGQDHANGRVRLGARAFDVEDRTRWSGFDILTVDVDLRLAVVGNTLSFKDISHDVFDGVRRRDEIGVYDRCVRLAGLQRKLGRGRGLALVQAIVYCTEMILA